VRAWLASPDGRIDSGERSIAAPGLRQAIEGIALEKRSFLSSQAIPREALAQLIGEPTPTYWVVLDMALNPPNDLWTLA
jgi:putative transposase